MKTYSREEVMSASIEYFGGDELAAEVFASKYSLKNKSFKHLESTPDGMHKRIAKEFARIEKKFDNPMSEEEIYGLIANFKYIVPQGSPMFGIGNDFQRISVSNCFVTKCVDSYGGILRADERIAQISKRRGGVGIDVSPIRPKGGNTSNSSLTTDGIGLFMERYSRTIREVGQNGRRGALMISLSVHHPEIMTFINIKRDLEKVTGANISVRITDEFMECLKKNKKYEQRWPVDPDDGEEPTIKQKVSAKEVWDELVKSNYLGAEPGILFWDNIITNSPADSYADVGFKTISTNPCGELPLCENDSCRLLLLNLASYVVDPFTDKARFDMALYQEHIGKAQRLMDDLVELEMEKVNGIIKKIKEDPENKEVKANELSLWTDIREKCKNGRRTGLGITGLGDCIAFLNLQYGSDESIKMVDKIYSNLRNEAYCASIQMAKERGVFPVYDHEKEKKNAYLKRLPKSIRDDMAKYGRRNIALLTTAPAGSASTQTQTTSGCEPAFKVRYFRKRKLQDSDTDTPDFVDKLGDKWKEYEVAHKGLQLFRNITGKDYEDSPYFGSEAGDLDHMTRVEIQAVATQYVDHAISSTINLPNDIDIQKVSELYKVAWEKGCKGLTVYRDGCRDGVLTASSVKDSDGCFDCNDVNQKMAEMIEKGERPEKIILSTSPHRTKVLECDIHRSMVGRADGESDWLFFVGKINGVPYEVFGGESSEFIVPKKYKTGWIIKNGKVDGITQYNLVLGSLDDENEKLEFKGIAKHFNQYEYGAFTRVTSLSIRHGVPIKYICEQMTKIDVSGDLFSFQRAMSRVLKKYIHEGEKAGVECPDCGSPDVVYRNGCPTCMICGSSKCS